jgi:hypothetical protein
MFNGLYSNLIKCKARTITVKELKKGMKFKKIVTEIDGNHREFTDCEILYVDITRDDDEDYYYSVRVDSKEYQDGGIAGFAVYDGFTLVVFD